MKKIFLLLIAVCQTTTFVFANKPPGNEHIPQSFETTFKEARNIVWVVGKNHSDVSFEMNRMPMKARFDNDGKLVRLLRYYKEEELPVFVKQKINQQYEGYKILGITELSAPHTLSYTISLQNDKKLLVVIADINGLVMSQKKFRRGDI